MTSDILHKHNPEIPGTKAGKVNTRRHGIAEVILGELFPTDKVLTKAAKKTLIEEARSRLGYAYPGKLKTDVGDLTTTMTNTGKNEGPDTLTDVGILTQDGGSESTIPAQRTTVSGRSSTLEAAPVEDEIPLIELPDEDFVYEGQDQSEPEPTMVESRGLDNPDESDDDDREEPTKVDAIPVGLNTADIIEETIGGPRKKLFE